MKRVFTVLLLLFTFSGIAQTFPETLPSLSESQNLFQHEEKFRNWLSEQPKGTKGWKWMARYEHELLRRIDTSGNMPTSDVLLKNNREIENIRASYQNSRKKASSWVPAGPYGRSDLFGIGRVNCIAFHPTDSSTFYIGFGQGGIWKTTNGGESYTPLGDNLPILRVSAITIDPNNPEIIYISLADFAYIGYDLYTADRKRNTYYGVGVWKSTNGGNSWQQTGLKNQLSEAINSITRTIWVNPSNSKEVIVVGTKGIFKSFDGGDTWSNKVLDKMSSSLVQHPNNSKILFATAVFVGSIKQGEAGIWKSEDAGNTWRLLPTGIGKTSVQRIEVAISPTSPNLIYAVSCDVNNGFEGFYRSADFGETWQKSSFRGNLLSTSYTTAGGQGFYDLCIMVHPTKPQTVYVGGLILNETNDGGNSWRQATGYSTVHPDQHALNYNPLNNTIYLCNDGGVYTTKEIIANTTVNLSWKFIAKGINATSCYRLGLSEDGSKIITGAQDNNMFLFKNNKEWTNEFEGDGMEGAFTQNYVYGSSQYGYISFFNLNDANKLRTNIFPPATNNDAGEWTTPFVINNKSNQVIIAGGNVHKLEIGQERNRINTISNFKIYSPTRFPQVSTALAVPKNNPEIIYIAKKATPILKQSAELWRTTNNGEFWENITNNIFKESYVTYLAVDNNFPERVWATLSNFEDGKKVYYSNDGGKNWENITYNLPNLPANTIVYQSEEDTDILYVGMDVGVYYLVEGTKEWKPLMANLPNVIIHELEINNNTKKLFAATFGRGIWSTDLVYEKSPQADDFYGMDVSIYPVPNDGKFTIKANYNNIESIQIIDIMGRVRYQEQLQPKALKFSKYFNINNLNSGIYFVKLNSGSLSKTIRIAIN
ncbi:glycosyl hydrolase BNR repeat-containing protein [Emticicia oligotrophica DSM 17448]|uniref:Glycosyl hydrolase BNR repeat-containing protein n=1 Tax=Emticicia oligotrophica (strain DSM 17448 / CIP 109782 / MTCC 6937 / GPTSA100-15) TaxID=929562 RepID=A0ABN4ADV3_EMTOG|nr:T9SS type A sorting domain-containing protein [Emticicia oligotrophica]AFK01827.1 glycosyl hydrolase BNR repeat-containing protein [Emticicia oligotrophica DSM 17448]